MPDFIGGVTIPAVPNELITAMKAAFPAPTLTPGFDRDKALWEAAQHDVVLWIVAHAGSQTKADPVAAQKATIRYGS